MINKELHIQETNAKELVRLISEQVKVELHPLLETIQEPKEEEAYLSIDETSKLLGVDKSTLRNWKLKEKLVPVGLGGRVFYLKSDIKKAMIKLGED